MQMGVLLVFVAGLSLMYVVQAVSGTPNISDFRNTQVSQRTQSMGTPAETTRRCPEYSGPSPDILPDRQAYTLLPSSPWAEIAPQAIYATWSRKMTAWPDSSRKSTEVSSGCTAFLVSVATIS